MTRTALAFILVGLMAVPAAAQGRGRGSGRIPPGHMPASGECRVWYDGVPPGHQPPATSCAEAERIAARDRSARVIHGSDAGRRGRDDGWLGGRDDDRRGRDARDDRARREWAGVADARRSTLYSMNQVEDSLCCSRAKSRIESATASLLRAT